MFGYSHTKLMDKLYLWETFSFHKPPPTNYAQLFISYATVANTGVLVWIDAWVR